MATFSNYIEGPRWARCDKAIKNGAWELGLKCDVERETSLLFETVRFRVEGDADKIEIFRRRMVSAVESWNGR